MNLNINLMEPIFDDEMLNAAINALKEEFFLRGESVKEFENEFSKYINVKYAIAVNSGTTALHLSMIAMDIKENDIVVTTPATFIATANSIKYTGAKPLFVDISLDDYTIDPIVIEKALKKYGDRIKAIMPVHLYGHTSKMKEILELKDKYNFKIIEDACQAHGGEYYDKKLGSVGDVAAFSFYPSKNMTVAGDGGMITTDDSEISE
ncbi:MAG: DegT/DnrJ/EryC1/StrS family aminotransferase, partial [Candidatus Heimdallarchaeaceae archaeon]